ncbi:MAG: hypothetical protein HYY24_23025 [Verrucomicrobia bacterium]|nr:hypothetical protein [Verrucomicrobiota bacterium]
MNTLLEAIAADRPAKFLGWMFASCLLVTLLVWLLELGPYLRKRSGRSTFFLLPWAPWKDYRDCLELLKKHHRNPRSSIIVFKWLSILDVVCLLSFGLRLMFLRF